MKLSEKTSIYEKEIRLGPSRPWHTLSFAQHMSETMSILDIFLQHGCTRNKRLYYGRPPIPRKHLGNPFIYPIIPWPRWQFFIGLFHSQVCGPTNDIIIDRDKLNLIILFFYRRLPKTNWGLPTWKAWNIGRGIHN